MPCQDVQQLGSLDGPHKYLETFQRAGNDDLKQRQCGLWENSRECSGLGTVECVRHYLQTLLAQTLASNRRCSCISIPGGAAHGSGGSKKTGRLRHHNGRELR